MKKVRDIMTQPVHCLKAHQSLPQAIGEFDARMISGAPVVDAAGLAVGHLSRSGISTYLANSPSSAAELVVGDVMEDFALKISPDNSLSSLVETMLTSRIHRLIICDEQGHPVGIVTTMDVMAHFYDQMMGTSE